MSVNRYFILLAASALLLLGARTLTNSDQISWDVTTPGQIKANPVYLPVGIDVSNMNIMVTPAEVL